MLDFFTLYFLSLAFVFTCSICLEKKGLLSIKTTRYCAWSFSSTRIPLMDMFIAGIVVFFPLNIKTFDLPTFKLSLLVMREYKCHAHFCSSCSISVSVRAIELYSAPGPSPYSNSNVLFLRWYFSWNRRHWKMYVTISIISLWIRGRSFITQ